MTKCYLDSNVLVNLRNEDSDDYEKAVNIVHRLIKNEALLFISPLCLDEYIHATRLRLIKNKEKSIFQKLHSLLNDVLEIPNLSIINPPTDQDSQLKVLSLMEDYSLRPRDAYHLLTMQANGVDAFATFDNDFDKVFQQKLLHKA